MEWTHNLDERQQKEVEFARHYAADFNHGTDGHSRLVLIALLARLLDEGYGNLVAAHLPPHDPSKPLNPKKPASFT